MFKRYKREHFQSGRRTLRSVNGANRPFRLTLCDSYKLNDTVLANDVECMDYPQACKVRLRSVVRLQRLDKRLCGGSHASDFIESTPGGRAATPVPSMVLSRIPEDRKFGAGRRRPALFGSQLPRDMVERRAKIVHDVSDHESPMNNRCDLGVLDPERVLTAVRLTLYDNGIGIRFQKGINCGFAP